MEHPYWLPLVFSKSLSPTPPAKKGQQPNSWLLKPLPCTNWWAIPVCQNNLSFSLLALRDLGQHAACSGTWDCSALMHPGTQLIFPVEGKSSCPLPVQYYADLVQSVGISSKTVISIIINSGFANPVFEGVWAQGFSSLQVSLCSKLKSNWRLLAIHVDHGVAWKHKSLES